VVTGQLQDCDQTPQEPDIIIIDQESTATIAAAQKVDELSKKVDVMKHCQSSQSIEQLMQKMYLTTEEIHDVQCHTMDQNKSALWKAARKGRITASNFYRVHTKVNTMKKKPDTEFIGLVNNLVDPPSLGHLDHIKHGIESEEKAIDQVVTLLSDAGHEKVQVHSCGLFIDHTCQYLGASPDGIISCDCCEDRLLEIKSPSSENPSCIDKNGKLKTKHVYYGQIQGQMMITGITKCVFFLFYNNISQSKMEVIDYDEIFSSGMKTNLCLFFEQCMAPEIIPHLSKKRKVI
jgi:hypothetical protein